MKSIRRHFFSAMLALAALLEFSATAQTIIFSNAPVQAIPRRASIILIVADDLGYGDLSCCGQTQFQTPNLDKLAADGIRCTNYDAGGVAESPAQAALMLGRDSAHLRQRADAEVPLAANDMTVAQLLQNAGYHTGMIGEWTLGDENSAGAPWKKGFDEFAGYLNPNDANNFYADFMWHLDSNYTYDESYYDPISGHWRQRNKADGISTPGKEEIYPNTLKDKSEFIPDLFTKAACNFIKNNLPDEFNRYRPFFLLLHYKMPGNGAGHPPSDAPYSDEPWPQPEKNKAAMVSRLDGYIGQIREQLGKSGMTNNFIIFFTSGTIPKKTNGVDPAFFHSNVPADDLRAPMIVCWPDNLPAGQVSGFKWSAKDFLPTAAEIGYAKTPKAIDGSSVLAELRGESK